MPWTWHPRNSLTSKKYYFGHVGGPNNKVQFRLRREFLTCASPHSQKRRDKIVAPNSTTLREIMTNAPFEGKNRKLIDKPDFLFGDSFQTSNESLYDEEYKWLRLIRGHHMFLPNMERSYPFYLPPISFNSKTYELAHDKSTRWSITRWT